MFLCKRKSFASHKKGSFLVLLNLLLDEVVDPSPHKFYPFFLGRLSRFGLVFKLLFIRNMKLSTTVGLSFSFSFKIC